ERAADSGTRQFVVFAPASGVYTLLEEDRTNPGRANALIVSDPGSKISFVKTIGSPDYPGVSILSADFDGGAEIGFDWKGSPLNSTQTPLAATGTVTLTTNNTVQVLIGSGLVTCTTP